MSENTSPQPAYRGRRLPRGTRMLRMRTTRRAEQQGQPARTLTDPRIPHKAKTTHMCGWCGGVVAHWTRQVNRARVLCHSCMRAEFGSAEAYDSFIRSERARTRERARKAQGLTAR